jgi:uncharacterized protein (TIGR03086 family)
MNEVVTRHRQAVDGFSQRVDAAGGRWDAPSPCEGWTAREVVDHVTGNHRMIVERLGGADAPGPTGDPSADWVAARDAALTVLEQADLSQVVEGPMGPMPAEIVCGIMTNDVLVHTWDLARAVGADEALPVDLVEGAYAALLPFDDLLRQSGFFGPKLEVSEAASTQDRLLAFLGRQP